MSRVPEWNEKWGQFRLSLNFLEESMEMKSFFLAVTETVNKGRLLVLIVAILSLELVAQVKPGDSSSIGQTSTTQVAIGEEPESPQPEERMARAAKSARYNGGGCDLMMSGDCFFEHIARGGIPLIPVRESAIVLVGKVTRVQPYLSADRTHIYTETALQVDEVFKSPDGFSRSSDQTLITDQFGGTLRMSSGRVIHDGSRIGFLGQAYVGGRYVFFLRQVHEGKDFAILTAYELRDGKVYELTEDGSPSNALLSRTPQKPDSLSDEHGFLQTIRQHDTVDPKTGNPHP